MQYCPKCGVKGLRFLERKKLVCETCDFVYFHNIASAVAAFITVAEEVLFIRRAAEPGKGLLGFPGGFVDLDETAEEAIYREIQEELGIVLTEPLNYVGCWPNLYPYKNIHYHTQDIYYHIRLKQKPRLNLAPNEVSEVLWRKKDQIKGEDLAFTSGKLAIESFLSQCPNSLHGFGKVRND